MSSDPLIEQASHLDSRARTLAADPFADLPQFSHDFVSELFPEMNGPVVINYPTMGEMLEIERLVSRGRPYSEVMATLEVLVNKAPSSWYKVPKGEKLPVLAIGRMPYDPAFFKIYTAFTNWRDTFRPSPVEGAGGETK